MLEPGGEEAFDQRLKAHAAVLLPACHRNLAIALGIDIDVQRQHYALGAVLFHPASHQIRGLDGGGADHHPVGAGGQQIRHVLLAAHPAAHLHRRLGYGEQLGDEGELARFCILGSVQIHQVQLLRPLGNIVVEAGLRAAAVCGLLAVVPLIESDYLTIDEVDCGNDHPCYSSRKFCSKRAPAAPDRSGWNWAPKKLSRPTMAVKGWP
ncbi:hypothetical protein D3C75_295180 [compost metagenome]